MTNELINDLLDYHYWARDRVLAALQPLTEKQFTRDLVSSFRSIRDTAVHIYAAELIWYSRWTGVSPAGLVAAKEFPDVATLRLAWQDLERDVRALVSQLGPDGVGRRFDYKTTSGQPESTVFWQMFQHVVNHASYHRGQLTTMLRQAGAAPPQSTDLIAFYRERPAQTASQQQRA